MEKSGPSTVHRGVGTQARSPRPRGFGGRGTRAGIDDAAWLVHQLSGDRQVNDGDLGVLAARLSIVRLPRGQLLFGEGSVPTGVWAVRTGAVELVSGAGGSRRVVEIVRAGGIVGDGYALLRSSSPLGARTVASSECLFLDADGFRPLLWECPAIGLLWLEHLADLVLQLRSRLLQVMSGTLAERVARLLLEESHGDVLTMSQATIAQMLGSRRGSVNGVLRELRERGLVELGYGTVALKDRAALREVANGTSRGSEAAGRAPDE